MKYFKVTVEENSTRNIIVKANDKEEATDIALSIGAGAWSDNQDYEESHIETAEVSDEERQGRIVYE